MADKPWYEDDEFLLSGNTQTQQDIPDAWFTSEEFNQAPPARPSVAAVEEAEVGSPLETAGKQYVESAGNLGRTLLAAPAALISGADRLLTGRGNGLETFNEEYAKYTSVLGRGYSGDPAQDTPQERVGRVVAQTAAAGTEGFLGGVFSLWRSASSTVNSISGQVISNFSRNRQFQEAGESLSAQYLTAIKNAPEQVRSLYAEMLENPGRFTAAEITGVLGASGGAGLAEMFLPGNERARIAAEVIGGAVSPMRRIAQSYESAAGAVSRMFGRFSEAGAEAAVSARILKGIKNSGEDAGQWLARLRDYNEQVTLGNQPELSTGIATGNEYFLALENQAIRRNVAVGAAREDKLRAAFTEYDRVVQSMLSSGDPQVIRDGAILARAHYEELINTSVLDAQTRALEVVRRFEGADAGQASREVFDIINDSVTRTRRVEDALWEQVPKNVFVRTSPIKESLDSISGRLTPSETYLPRELRSFEGDFRMIIDQVGPDGSRRVPTTGDVINLRKRLGDRARSLRAEGNYTAADIAGELQKGLRAALESTAVSSELGGNPAYTRAVQFSDARIARYRDTFARRADPQQAESNRASPEQLLDEAFGASRSSNARMRSQAGQRMRELREGGAETSLESVQGSNDPADWFDTSILGERIASAQDEFLRSVVIRDLAQERNGQYVINANRVEDFMRNNPKVMQDFPVLAGDLSDLTTAQRLVDQATEAGKLAQREVDEMAFSRLTGDLNPEDVVYDIAFTRNNANVMDNMRNLIQIANRAPNPEQAKNGLRSATISALFRAAGTRDEGINFFANLKQVLDTPIREGGPTNSQMLEQLGVIDGDYLTRLNRIADSGAQVVERTNRASRIDLTEVEGLRNVLEEFAIRLQGAWIGGKAGNLTGRPGGLVEAGAGAAAARQVFKKLPGAHAQEIMERAVLEPEYMVKLLEMTVVDNPRLTQQLDAFLIGAGYQALSEDFEDIPRLYDEQGDNYQEDTLFR